MNHSKYDRKLFSQQLSAVNKMSLLKVGALFMEMGTGKTTTAYHIIKAVKSIEAVIWVCPLKVKQTIEKEIELLGGFNCIFEVIGIESIQQSNRIYLDLLEKVCNLNTFLVADESIKIKNFEAKRTRRMIEISKKCQYKLILNGTPVTKNILDLWAQLEFLSPKILNMSFAQYKNTFCSYKTITQRKGSYKKSIEIITGYHNIAHLHSIIEPYIFQCSLSLPNEKEYRDYSYSLTSSEIEQYQAIKQYYLDLERMEAFDNNFFLGMIMALQQSYSLAQGKIDLLAEVLEEFGENKVIVYTKFVATREHLQKLYPNVKILSYGKHAFGLNLQQKNITVFFDKTFDYGARIQSEFRTYRTGQQSNCCFIDFSARNAKLDNLIDSNIADKTSLLTILHTHTIKEFITNNL